MPLPLRSRLALGHSQPPIQWVPVFFMEVKRPGRDDHSHSFIVEVKNEWNYTNRPTCVHGADRDFTFHLYRGTLSSFRPLRMRAGQAALAAVPLHRQSGSTRFSSKPCTLMLYHHSLKIKVLEMTSFGARASVTSNKHLSTARIIYM